MEALGINFGLLIVQIIAFIIVFLTLNAWVYQPLLNMMETRKQKIAQGLEDARVAAEARANAEKEAAKVITEAQTEASKIAEDQRRLRENMGALKGGSSEQQLVKRYVVQLNQQEDRIAVLRRENAGLEQKLTRAQEELATLIQALTLDVESLEADAAGEAAVRQ